MPEAIAVTWLSQLAGEVLARHAPGTELTPAALKRALPALAKNSAAMAEIEDVIRDAPTPHELRRADARCLVWLDDESIDLILTSPPYWTLKEYNESQGQLGATASYEQFSEELARVWRGCHRVLVKGGRLVVVVGDTVLDPFMGTGTTNLAASLSGRNSIGLEIDRQYLQMAARRLRSEHDRLFSNAHITVVGPEEDPQ